MEFSGRVLEIDLAKRQFRIHGIVGDVASISFNDAEESLVRNSLGSFVAATFAMNSSGARELLTLRILGISWEIRFNERRSLETVIEEQQIAPIVDVGFLALPEPGEVPLHEFQSVIKERHRRYGTDTGL